MSINIRIRDAVKRYGDTTVIPGLDLDIEPGEFFTLLGPRVAARRPCCA
ncbi:hypothetical protein [Tessaracoccus coleopterorum]|nr:hypothetical protein [Tessaracoccus coleopterorum]